MRRRTPVELDIHQDRWLVSYADFITLLFAFFVVMYSISYVNEGKYRVISSTLMDAFNVPPAAINPIQVGDPTLAVKPSAIDTAEVDSAKQEPSSFAEFDVLAAKLEEQFDDLIDEQVFKLNSNELWLEIEIKSEVLFPSASADPSLQAKAILEELAQTLADYGNGVQVGGFTDDVPINNRNFKSNWELSSARATSVVKLLAANGVAPQRLSAVGYGEFQPIADNATAAGRAQNRRLVIMISRDTGARPKINPEGMENNLTELSATEISSGESADGKNNDNENNSVVPSPTAPEIPVIKPIQLEGGGLLFTSDPELPRLRKPATAPGEPPDAADRESQP